MNKKVGIVIGIIIAILVCFFIGVIIINQNNNNNNIEANNSNQTNGASDEKEVKEEIHESEIKTESIVLSSKIGTQIQDLIYIPNIYSDSLFKEVEASGLNDRSKIMFTFAKIMSDDEYSSIRRQSPDYVGEYITSDDLQEVASKLFVDASNLKHQEIFLPNSYDSENGNYIKVPTGFVEFSYIKDIPYKIEETGDNITVYTYRIYIDCKIPDIIEESGASIQTIYYDSEKKNQAIVINDEKMDDESTQTEFLNEKISSGEIDKDKLKQGVYKITRKGNVYLIDDIK